jgi:hypothetical protein
MRRKVGKRGKRNVVFRSILAKGDKDEIATWNQDLVRILHVFNVRSICSCWEPGNSAAPSQTELAIDTNIRVADTQTRVVDTQMMVSDTRMTVMNTETRVTDTQKMVADIHRNILTGQNGASGKNQSVSAMRYP